MSSNTCSVFNSASYGGKRKKWEIRKPQLQEVLFCCYTVTEQTNE